MAFACVFCSASKSIDKGYIYEAEKVGEILSEYGYDLVYGGDKVGLMGAISQSMKKNNSKIVGVCVKDMYYEEKYNENCDEIVICDGLSERKQYMKKMADLFLVLPGGIGTLDELIEVISEKKLGYMKQTIIIYDSKGIYDEFFFNIENLIKEKFIKSDIRTLWYRVSDLKSLINMLDREKMKQV